MENEISGGKGQGAAEGGEIHTKVRDQLGGHGGTEAVSLLDLNGDETEGKVSLSGVAAVPKHEVALSADDGGFLDSLGGDRILANHAQVVEGTGLA